MAYATSKAANFFLGYEFGRRYGNRDGVLHDSFNPGNLDSQLQRHARATMGETFISVLAYLLCYQPIFGAYTEIYAGLSQDLAIEHDQGAYIVPWGRKSTVRPDIVAQLGEGKNSEKLWEWCERETRQYA